MRFIHKNKIYLQVIAFLASETVFLNLITWSPLKVIAFGVLLLVPGTFFSYLVKIPKPILWPSRVAFSLILFMLIGVTLNTALPFIHILTPLRTIYLLPSITLTTLILAWFGRKRGTERHQTINNKISIKTIVILFLYFLILSISILGAIRLNNGGGNQLTMISLGSLSILSITALFALKKNERYIFPAILYITGLSVLLMFSIRSSYVTGWDIQAELRVFNLTANNYRWLLSSDNNVYNATLSLTILPTILKEFLHVSSDTVFKLYYPLLTAMIAPIIYALSNKFMSMRQAFLAALFFIIQGEFIQQLPALARQQIAYIFFALILYYILNNSLKNRVKEPFIIVLGIAMVVSHYSTAYAGLGALLIAFVIFKIITSYYKVSGEQERSFLSIKVIIVLLLFTFLWYGQISNSSRGIVNALDTSLKNLVTAKAQEQKSVVAQEALFGTAESNATLVSDYGKNTINKNLSLTERTLIGNNPAQPANTQSVSVKSNILTEISSAYDFIAQKAFKAFLVLGIIIFTVQVIRKVELKKEFVALYSIALSFSLLLLAITLFPSLSLFYNFERLYQQALMVLGIIIILSGSIVLKIICQKMFYVYIILGILFVGYFLGYAGFLTEIGGGAPVIQLSNYGTAYDQFYKHKGETLSAQWLVKTKKPNQFIAADLYGQIKLNLFYNNDNNISSNLILHALDKDTYIYETYSNIHSGVELELYDDQTIIINFPSTLIDSQKSLVYTNGDSLIYY